MYSHLLPNLVLVLVGILVVDVVVPQLVRVFGRRNHVEPVAQLRRVGLGSAQVVSVCMCVCASGGGCGVRGGGGPVPQRGTV